MHRGPNNHGTIDEPATKAAAHVHDVVAFIRANTRLCAVPHAPEVLLHVADEAFPLWQKTEGELGAMGLPPPFWAFAWAGGQALARFLLDHPDMLAGHRVLDLGSGSGLCAIAAAKAGAARVVASEIDPFAQAAIGLNASANGVQLDIVRRDLLEPPSPPQTRYDVILAGDLFYESDMAGRVLSYLDRQAALGSLVLIGDPGRSYLPRHRLFKRREYLIPVSRALEDQDIKRTAVWTLASG